MDFNSRTEVSKGTSDRLKLAEAEKMKWFTAKARNEPQECIAGENSGGGAVSEMITEIEVDIPSASVSKQTTNTLAENPNVNIKLPTEPNQNTVNYNETAEKFACERLR